MFTYASISILDIFLAEFIINPYVLDAGICEWFIFILKFIFIKESLRESGAICSESCSK